MMLKIYGSPICIDCRNFEALRAARGFAADFVNITENTANLKEFLKIRDASSLFDEVRTRGGIGIPLFAREDGLMTFDLDEALAWIGQAPHLEEELPEKRPAPVCESCR